MGGDSGGQRRTLTSTRARKEAHHNLQDFYTSARATLYMFTRGSTFNLNIRERIVALK